MALGNENEDSTVIILLKILGSFLSNIIVSVLIGLVIGKILLYFSINMFQMFSSNEVSNIESSHIGCCFVSFWHIELRYRLNLSDEWRDYSARMRSWSSSFQFLQSQYHRAIVHRVIIAINIE